MIHEPDHGVDENHWNHQNGQAKPPTGKGRERCWRCDQQKFPLRRFKGLLLGIRLVAKMFFLGSHVRWYLQIT